MDGVVDEEEDGVAAGVVATASIAAVRSRFGSAEAEAAEEGAETEAEEDEEAAEEALDAGEGEGVFAGEAPDRGGVAVVEEGEAPAELGVGGASAIDSIIAKTGGIASSNCRARVTAARCTSSFSSGLKKMAFANTFRMSAIT